jgi:glutamate synthase domain-containing protein 2
VSKDSDQTQTAPRKFKLGPLGSLNQVTKGLAKTIRAMADGTLDSQVGARICNGLGIMRACFETQKLEQLESRMDEIAHRVARDRTNGTRERTSTDEAQRLSN